MGRILTLPKEITTAKINGSVVSFPKTKKVTVCYVTDTAEDVNAVITFVEGPGETFLVELWSGKKYKDVGQWTDTDIDTRLLELLNQ